MQENILYHKDKWGTKNGIYYFLGNIPEHSNHAIALYEELGGVFVVLSEKAFEYCLKMKLNVVMLDNDEDIFLQYNTNKISRTIEFLNLNAKIVIYYEVFSIIKKITCHQVMLTHGNSFKDYYIDWRKPYLKYFTYIAGLGPDWERRTLLAGASEESILKVGLARADEIIQTSGTVTHQAKVARILNLDARKKIVTYMPTWWGPSSVYDVGKRIVRYMPEEYSIIFRPHPSTPDTIIEEYLDYINNEKLNASYVPEGMYKDLSLLDIYQASSLFIGDMSSVMLDALLTDKPVLFAFDDMDRSQNPDLYIPIKEVYDCYPSIDKNNVKDVAGIVNDVIRKPVDKIAYEVSKRRIFYGLEGNSVSEIIKSLKRLV